MNVENELVCVISLSDLGQRRVNLIRYKGLIHKEKYYFTQRWDLAGQYSSSLCVISQWN